MLSAVSMSNGDVKDGVQRDDDWGMVVRNEAIRISVDVVGFGFDWLQE